jgi:hypothetical protein
MCIIFTFILPCRLDHAHLPIYSPPGSGGAASESSQEEGSCGCEEDDFPPGSTRSLMKFGCILIVLWPKKGAGFAFRREGYAVIGIEGGKVTRQRQFFENERVTFKEVLSPGDGKTFPMLGQTAVLRYTEFTSNECLPETTREENMAGLRIEDLDHSIVNAIEGLDELILKMSVGEKAMFFASLDLGCVRALQVMPNNISLRTTLHHFTILLID